MSEELDLTIAVGAAGDVGGQSSLGVGVVDEGKRGAVILAANFQRLGQQL